MTIEEDDRRAEIRDGQVDVRDPFLDVATLIRGPFQRTDSSLESVTNVCRGELPAPSPVVPIPDSSWTYRSRWAGGPGGSGRSWRSGGPRRARKSGRSSKPARAPGIREPRGRPRIGRAHLEGSRRRPVAVRSSVFTRERTDNLARSLNPAPLPGGERIGQVNDGIGVAAPTEAAGRWLRAVNLADDVAELVDAPRRGVTGARKLNPRIGSSGHQKAFRARSRIHSRPQSVQIVDAARRAVCAARETRPCCSCPRSAGSRAAHHRVRGSRRQSGPDCSRPAQRYRCCRENRGRQTSPAAPQKSMTSAEFAGTIGPDDLSRSVHTVRDGPVGAGIANRGKRAVTEDEAMRARAVRVYPTTRPSMSMPQATVKVLPGTSIPETAYRGRPARSVDNLGARRRRQADTRPRWSFQHVRRSLGCVGTKATRIDRWPAAQRR